ncbi:AMP-binding enzyme [Methylobacillus rhizosphaerae]|uniref:AMP-binding enzyme n=1 Tax=Methylobacillus rhizosphaerae TaxID=551994 RepID=A0A238ZKB8_9PROT|nr:AMP-binding protein [Methylobacillus rhizosphaerae]SNR83817.1 AMP-binding enzyme [Methylobacillus rhizosphaerae]
MVDNTFPHQLLHQAATQPALVALRHKYLGIWHQQSWRELSDEVGSLARALAELGLGQGDTLVLLTYPRREALLLSMAAQWLGAIAAPVDPDLDKDTLALLLSHLQSRFVFAEGQDQVGQALLHGATRVVYAEARGMTAYSHENLHAYIELVQTDTKGVHPLMAREQDVAFALYRITDEQQVQVEHFRHVELLQEGRHLVLTERLGQREEAFAARVFATSGHLRYLLSPWLTAGFTLNFPENIVTRDADRRELGPTLVVGTRETYQRLESLVKARLPIAGSYVGRFVTYALQSDGSRFQKLLAYWLIKRPLKDVIGFSHIHLPLLIGPALSQESLHFFRSLGIHIRTWDKIANWRTLSATTSNKLLAETQTDSIKRALS